VQFQVDTWQGSLRPEFVIDHIEAPPGDVDSAFDCGPECTFWPAHSSGPVTPGAPAGSGTVNGPVALRMPIARDLRDRQGCTGALAQVLASSERTLVAGCSLPHMLKEARERLPLSDLCPGGLTCSGLGCDQACATRAQDSAVVVTEWDALTRDLTLLSGRVHLVAADPPYRREHVTLLETAARNGINIHLHYGHDERASTARLLRYLVHPRFAMVCVYRALETLRSEEGEPAEAALLAYAATLAWEEARVALGPEALYRALGVLRELRLDQLSAGEAKLEARNIPAYAEAEAEYEECSRLCQTL
jgi:hypothetical protein